MSSAHRLGAVAFVTIVVATGAARAGCALVQITTEPATLAGDWQKAILAVVEQTARTGMPWSCAGGALLLRVEDDDRAVLRFRDPEGHEVERHVPSPRALVATAEALLARALPHEAPPPAVDEIESAAERPPSSDDAALVRPERPERPARPARPVRPRGEPRYIVDATMGIRFSGPRAALWFAPALRATVPFDAWSVGVWARYGLPHVFGPLPTDFSMSQVNVGFSAGRQLLSTPIDLRVALTPSLSVVAMDADLDDNEVSGAKIDFYLGAAVSAAIPFSPIWRGVVVLDAEMVPAAIRAERRIDPVLPVLPAYEIGAAFGVELVAR
jgi:hypothetical protein